MHKQDQNLGTVQKSFANSNDRLTNWLNEGLTDWQTNERNVKSNFQYHFINRGEILNKIAMFKYFNSNCLFSKTIPLWGQMSQWLSQPAAGEFVKRVWEVSSLLCVTLYTLSIYPSANKQLRRHLPNPFCKFPCIWVNFGT